jgi:hypothetical protein
VRCRKKWRKSVERRKTWKWKGCRNKYAIYGNSNEEKTHRKATGGDEIPVAVIKTEGPLGYQWLYRVLRSIWKKR